MPHTRRALLAAVPAVVGLAGCNTGPGTADGDPYRTTTAPRTTTRGTGGGTPTTTEAGEPTDTAGTTAKGESRVAAVDLDVAAAFGSYFYEREPDLLRVAGGGEQYLLAEVSAGGGPRRRPASSPSGPAVPPTR